MAKGSRRASDGLASEALPYVDALHDLVRYGTGSETDAEDLVQETHARALPGGLITQGSLVQIQPPQPSSTTG